MDTRKPAALARGEHRIGRRSGHANRDVLLPCGDGTPHGIGRRLHAGCGSGLSRVLPPGKFLFSNADLSLLVHCPPEGEWIGLASEMKAGADGAGTPLSRRYDVHGPVGVAGQTLAVRNRRG